MLDLGDWIPAEITGTRITKEVSGNKIILSGRYGNGRPFRLVLNRFIDEQLFAFGCGLYAGEGTKGGKGSPFEFANSSPKFVATMMSLLDKLGSTDRRFLQGCRYESPTGIQSTASGL